MSKTVLFIKGTPMVSGLSKSMEVADAFLETYMGNNPQDKIIRKDVFATEIPYIDADILKGWQKLGKNEKLTDMEAKKISAYNAFTEEFIAADKLIIQSPMWNLSVPSQLKGYLDTLMVAGKTFKYTENGPIGLMKGKKAIHIHGAGGIYSNTTGIEHSDSFVTGILSFLSIQVEPTIWVEGIDGNPNAKTEIMKNAISQAKIAAAKF